MGVYDILFAINILMLLGVIAYHCLKKEKRAVLSNLVVFLLFVLIKVAQVYYVHICSFLYELLGEENFNDLRNLLRAVLSFGSSVTVGVQLISELTNIFVLVFFATRAVAIFVKKCSKKIFSTNVPLENEKFESEAENISNNYIYLVYGKLLN